MHRDTPPPQKEGELLVATADGKRIDLEDVSSIGGDGSEDGKNYELVSGNGWIIEPSTRAKCRVCFKASQCE
jgi:hypothetical protein